MKDISLKRIEKARLLMLFRSFCEKNASIDAKQRLRNIYFHSSDPLKTTKYMIFTEAEETMNDEDIAELYELISAFLNRSLYRKAIPASVKTDLLGKQHYKCAICDKTIDIRAHLDHRIPFKYVGDALQDNYQMLCPVCNRKKSASMDYQMRFFLGSI